MRMFLWTAGLIVLAISVVLLLPLALPQEQRAPLDGPELTTLRYDEAGFSNDGLTLVGLLFLPDGDRPHPAAVFIRGATGVS